MHTHEHWHVLLQHRDTKLSDSKQHKTSSPFLMLPTPELPQPRCTADPGASPVPSPQSTHRVVVGDIFDLLVVICSG